MSDATTLTADPDYVPPGASEFYEIVDGKVVEPAEMGVYETLFATILAEAVSAHFVSAGRPGRIVVEGLFRLRTDSRLQRRPDLAYVSYERWPRDRPVPRAAAWGVVPDLAVEVVSPSDLAVDLLEKLDDYFRAGVRLVWVVYPRHARFFVYEGPKRVTVLDATDTLDGGDVLHGFRLPLAGLFSESA
jgi:Uma2 family endonuclease